MRAYTAGSGDCVVSERIRDGLDCFLWHAPVMPTFLEYVKPSDAVFLQNNLASRLGAMPTASEKPFADIGDRLKWHRDLLGLDQADYVAPLKMVKRSAYSNWEVGSSRLSLNGALEIVEKYELSLDFLYRGNADTLPLALRNAWLSRSFVKA